MHDVWDTKGEKTFHNNPCEARHCKSNLRGYCQNTPSIAYKKVTPLDTYKSKEKVEVWGCKNFVRREEK